MRIIAAIVLVLSFGSQQRLLAQDSRVWKRVSTGEGYVIELDVTSLEFANQALRVQIRTVLDKEVVLKDKSHAKSKVRLEKLEYNFNRQTYRVLQVVLLDATGKPIESQDFDTAVWRPAKPGGMMDRILLAARSSLPFGRWQVASYRLAEDTGGARQAPEELKNLIGIGVSIEAAMAKVDESACRNPTYKSEHFTKGELLERLGGDIKLPEVHTERLDLVYVKCASGGWEPPHSMLLKLPEGRMLMLWKGVFLTLKRA